MTKSSLSPWVLALSLSLTAGLALTAGAAEPAPYTAASLTSAQKSGATVVVDFHADWCSTCRALSPMLKELSAEKGLGKVVFLVADFDEEVALKRSLKVARQSTIVVFKGQTEVARSIGVTDKDELRALLKKGL